MPTPTTVISFGDDSEDSVFAKVELDSDVNLDEYGEELTEFLDTELVYILVHVEPGASITDISTSLGTITNPNNPSVVTRTNEIEDVVFKGKDETYSLAHYPSSNVSITWKGRTRSVSRSERVITCNGAAGICDISYSYKAYQYILSMSSLNLEEGEDFTVEVSFKVE